MILRLLRAGTVDRPPLTLDLTDKTNYLAMDYPLQTPTVSLANILDSVQQGIDGEITVTETITVLCMGASRDVVANNINRLERMVTVDAPAGRQRANPAVLLTFQVTGQTAVYQSQILSGRLEVDSRWHLGWAGRKVEVRLHIERRYYWENVAMTELPISSRYDTSNGVGGRLIDNHTSNFVTIPAGAVSGGVLPAPARIWLINTNTAQNLYRNIYLACDAPLNRGTFFSRLIQAENKVPTSSGLVIGPPFTGSSGGSVLRLNISAGGVAQPRWASTLEESAGAMGRTYRLFARITWYTTALGQPIFVTPALLHGASSANLNPYNFEYALLGPPTQLQTELHDVGTISFPGATGTPAVMNIGLNFRAPAAATVEIDYVHPMPADNFRRLAYVGEGVMPGQLIGDDGVEDDTYATDANGRRVPAVTGMGRHLMLWPQTGLAQRIFVLADLGAQTPFSLYWTVRVFYRPRRLTI